MTDDPDDRRKFLFDFLADEMEKLSILPRETFAKLPEPQTIEFRVWEGSARASAPARLELRPIAFEQTITAAELEGYEARVKPDDLLAKLTAEVRARAVGPACVDRIAADLGLLPLPVAPPAEPQPALVHTPLAAAAPCGRYRPHMTVMLPYPDDPEPPPPPSLRATLVLDGKPQPGPIPEVVRGCHEDLTLDMVRRAVATLETNAVPPTADGTYHVHVSSVPAVFFAVVLQGLAPAYHSWRAFRRAAEFEITGHAPRPFPWDDHVQALRQLRARATPEEVERVRAMLRQVWRRRTAHRRQARKRRRGWA